MQFNEGKNKKIILLKKKIKKVIIWKRFQKFKKIQ